MKDVVYTAVFNDYDVLIEPDYEPGGIEFICFTDDPKKASGAWKPVVVDDCGLSPTLINRKYKILPHKYLSDYRYSIYLDGNIQITGDISNLFDCHLHSENIAVADHPRRGCIYREAEVCIEKGLVDEETTNRTVPGEGVP